MKRGTELRATTNYLLSSSSGSRHPNQTDRPNIHLSKSKKNPVNEALVALSSTPHTQLFLVLGLISSADSSLNILSSKATSILQLKHLLPD